MTTERNPDYKPSIDRTRELLTRAAPRPAFVMPLAGFPAADGESDDARRLRLLIQAANTLQSMRRR